MLVHIKPKKVNSITDLRVTATFSHQGVKYEERYKSKGQFFKALARKKDMLHDVVDYNLMKVFRVHNIEEYRSMK